MKIYIKTIVLIATLLILYGCCRSTRCVQITYEDGNPLASIEITYTDKAGQEQRIIRSFSGMSSSWNYNLELPHNTDWTAYFKATSSSGLRYFKTQYRHERNDVQLYYEPWQEEDFINCPKDCWDRKLEFENSVHGDVFGLHIYAEDFYRRNSGEGNVYVRFSEGGQEPGPGPGPDPGPQCESSGELYVLLIHEPNSGFPVTWEGRISQSGLDNFCTGLHITKISLPCKVKCSSTTEVCISEWGITIGDHEYTDFTCDESSNYCELELSDPIALNTRYQIEAHSISHLPCEPGYSCPSSALWESVQVTFEVE